MTLLDSSKKVSIFNFISFQIWLKSVQIWHKSSQFIWLQKSGTTFNYIDSPCKVIFYLGRSLQIWLGFSKNIMPVDLQKHPWYDFVSSILIGFNPYSTQIKTKPRKPKQAISVILDMQQLCTLLHQLCTIVDNHIWVQIFEVRFIVDISEASKIPCCKTWSHPQQCYQ